MLPLKDENPTSRTPFVTLIILAACVIIHVLVVNISGTEPITLSDGSRQNVDAEFTFTLEYAAIPCEIVKNRPLDIDEVERTFADRNADPEACDDISDDQAPFADKHVWLAMVFSMFLHGDWFHLGSNMLVLWIFGNNVEDRMGVVRYVLFYLAAGVVATMAHVGVQPDSTIPLVGASGAIAGLMGAYLVWYPEAPIRTLILVFLKDIRAKWFLGLWFVMQFFTGTDSAVAWMAHVGGFVFGVVVGLVVRYWSRGPKAALREPYRPDAPSQWDPTGGIGPGPYARPRRLGEP